MPCRRSLESTAPAVQHGEGAGSLPVPRSQACVFILPARAGEYFWESGRSAMQGSGRGKCSVHRMKKNTHPRFARSCRDSSALSCRSASASTLQFAQERREVKALRDGSRGEPITHRATSLIKANILDQERDASGLVPRLGEFTNESTRRNPHFLRE